MLAAQKAVLMANPLAVQWVARKGVPRVDEWVDQKAGRKAAQKVAQRVVPWAHLTAAQLAALMADTMACSKAAQQAVCLVAWRADHSVHSKAAP